MKWSYGVTTVPSRRDVTLLRTLESLKKAGFSKPHLFVDGSDDSLSWEREFGLRITTRFPAVRAYGNWLLSIGELFIREPDANRYAIFQDDFVTYPFLRNYLETCPYPSKGYWNLYTFPSNQTICPRVSPGGKQIEGWYKSNQMGRGAVALVFDRETVLTLLTNQSPPAVRHMAERPLDPERGHKSIDGGVVTALRKAGWSEYVHNPSLVQHIGSVSAIGNKPQKLAISFRGESFDARDMISKGS